MTYIIHQLQAYFPVPLQSIIAVQGISQAVSVLLQKKNLFHYLYIVEFTISTILFVLCVKFCNSS